MQTQIPASSQPQDGSEIKRLDAIASAFLFSLGATLMVTGARLDSKLIGIPTLTTGLVFVGASVRRSLRKDIGANDLIDGLIDVCIDDVGEALAAAATETHRLTAQLDPIIIGKLPERVQALIPESVNIDWFNNKGFWLESKYIAGGRRSGKSFLMTYEAYQTLKICPDAQLFIIDPHLGDESEWFGRNGAMIDRYCYKLTRKPEDVQVILNIIDKAYAEFEERVTEGDRSRSLYKVMIDEWEAVYKLLLTIPCQKGDNFPNYAAKFLDLDERIQDEGAKFGVEVTIGVHSFKKNRTGFDSDTIAQKHWIATGDALSQPNTKMPSNVPINRLETARQKIEAEHTPSPFAKTAILRVNTTPRAGQGCMKAVGIPYIDVTQMRFINDGDAQREAEWIKENAPKIQEAVRAGARNLRELSEAIGVNRGRWQYDAMKRYVDQVRQDRTQTTKEQEETNG